MKTRVTSHVLWWFSGCSSDAQTRLLVVSRVRLSQCDQLNQFDQCDYESLLKLWSNNNFASMFLSSWTELWTLKMLRWRHFVAVHCHCNIVTPTCWTRVQCDDVNVWWGASHAWRSGMQNKVLQLSFLSESLLPVHSALSWCELGQAPDDDGGHPEPLWQQQRHRCVLRDEGRGGWVACRVLEVRRFWSLWPAARETGSRSCGCSSPQCWGLHGQTAPSSSPHNWPSCWSCWWTPWREQHTGNRSSQVATFTNMELFKIWNIQQNQHQDWGSSSRSSRIHGCWDSELQMFYWGKTRTIWGEMWSFTRSVH